MTVPALALRAVDKIYHSASGGAVQAVRALDMTVEQGEIVALLGSSGCGKTSILRMIAGFEAVSQGTIRVAGQEVQALAPARRNVAMAFEGYSLYPPLTARENIAFALKSRRLDRAEIDGRVGEIARMLEIEDILERYPGAISGGQQQRVGLARALIRQADLHLLDEPIGQLEPGLRALLRGRMKHFIRERGLTAILVTHDQAEANALADRIAVMEDGELQQFDTPAHLKDRPANLFTGTFIGEPPMNVFAAEARGENGRIVFQLGVGATLDYAEDEFSSELRTILLHKRRVTIGIRPHAVRIAPGGVPVQVEENQWLGDQSHLAARFAGEVIVLVEHDSVPRDRPRTIGVVIASRDLHIFDTADGRAISHGGAPA